MPIYGEVRMERRPNMICRRRAAFKGGRFTGQLCAACAMLLAVSTGMELAISQEAVQATAEVRIVAKPMVPSHISSEGQTYVALEQDLRRIIDGAEPGSLRELKAMERQQAKVSEAIQKVSVNVQQGAAQGSGVIITQDGYVLTAAHVAGKPGREASVLLSDGTRVQAKTLGMNRNLDAGLLKITEKRAQPWPTATLGRSENLKMGQWCIAAGHPGGWQSQRGAVIRIGRILAILPGTLVTDCALIGGDSGGPLFNLNGELIGIHSRIGTDIEENMHVPVDVFDEHWKRMQRGDAWGQLPGFKPVIGIEGIRGQDAPLIGSVREGSPAHKAALEAGDRILKFDGIAISSFSQLQRVVEESLPGEMVVIEVARKDGAVLRLRLIVGVADQGE